MPAARAPAAPPDTLTAIAVTVRAPLDDPEAAGAFAALEFRGPEALDLLEGGEAEPLPAPLAARLPSTPIVAADAEEVGIWLRRQQVAPLPPVWNVLELAKLVRPGCPGESLDAVAGAFGLAPEEGGLAGEARLVSELFARLLHDLEHLEDAVLLHVLRLSAPLDWPLRQLFVELERRRARARLMSLGRGAPPPDALPLGAWAISASAGGSRRRQGLTPNGEPRPLEVEGLVAQLGPGGDLASALEGYEERAEQAEMVRAVAETFNGGGHLLVEAGTGTGKSLGYLLPAATAAAQNGWRVVISTATTTLQDQLYRKDLPVVEAAIGGRLPRGGGPRATVLKGRDNYLCLTRWQTLLLTPDLVPAERMLLIKALFWLPHTQTGDRAELQLSSGEEAAWSRLSASRDVCTPARCAYHRAGVCYLARARRLAEESHVVITNHALLLSDLVTGSRVLPEYEGLVVDEAHHLEDEATTQLGWRLGERELLNALERLWAFSDGRGPSGLIPEALAYLRRQHAGARRERISTDDVARTERQLQYLVQAVRGVFAQLTELLRDGRSGSAGEEGAATVRITSALRAGSAWQALEALWDGGSRNLLSSLGMLAEVLGALEMTPGEDEERNRLVADLAGQADWWALTRQRLDQAIQAPDPGFVYWLSMGARGSATLSAAPLDVAETLRGTLFAEPRATILSSATLSVGGSFSYVKRRLGLEDADELALGSPFDFRQAALVYVPHDLPDPTQPGYADIVNQVLLDTIARLRGRTLALFTSRAHLRAAYGALRWPLRSAGITLLGQGMDDGSRTRLLETFRSGERVALFGTSSFWEGIDVVGEALSCVVLARLPFAVPTDPVYAARSEQYEDPFGEFAVPQAVLRFKQGFGRLIRSRSDRGVVVVLDRRLVTRGYGQIFLRSLPPCSVKQGPAGRTASVAEEWLARRW